jgi:aspartate ammonia-lyase
MRYRIERDSLGEKKIPGNKYYGVQTVRALENFKISGIPLGSRHKLVKALAAIKYAAALTNFELGILDKVRTNAIIKAAQEVYDGKYYDQFPIDIIQGGAGTSSNMNVNEVICNRALEIMGYKKGEYKYLHPNNHVNLSQSTNDVYPTAIRIALIWSTPEFIEGIVSLRDAFYVKAEEFKDVIKIGKTQLQDAVPMTLGQEFQAFGVTINEDTERLREILTLCHEINMGATAIGTGINTLPGYAETVTRHLSNVTRLPLQESPNLIEATSDTGVFVTFSSLLKRTAVKLTKICNDLRLLSSGPKAGLYQINLPAVQPGSSIMPAKINPVIPEVVNQVCFLVMGYDTTITAAASAGQLQLNAFEPVIVYSLFEAMTLLKKACIVLKEKCVDGITANKEHCAREVMDSPGLLTAFTPYIGYEEATKIAKQAQTSNKTVYEVIKKSGLLSDKDIETILSPVTMTSPHARFDIVSKVRAQKRKK